MRLHSLLGKIRIALSIKSLAGVDRIRHGNNVHGCHLVNGVLGSLYTCLRQYGSLSVHVHCARAPRLSPSVSRGFSTGRDDKGSQPSEKLGPQEGATHRASNVEAEEREESKDSSSCEQQWEQEHTKSSDQQEHATQHEAAAEQEQEQSSSKCKTAEHASTGQQPLNQDDSPARDAVCPLLTRSEQCLWGAYMR